MEDALSGGLGGDELGHVRLRLGGRIEQWDQTGWLVLRRHVGAAKGTRLVFYGREGQPTRHPRPRTLKPSPATNPTPYNPPGATVGENYVVSSSTAEDADAIRRQPPQPRACRFSSARPGPSVKLSEAVVGARDQLVPWSVIGAQLNLMPAMLGTSTGPCKVQHGTDTSAGGPWVASPQKAANIAHGSQAYPGSTHPDHRHNRALWCRPHQRADAGPFAVSPAYQLSVDGVGKPKGDSLQMPA